MSERRKVALITGAARRIGAGIARRLHADGYDLALHYRSSAADMDALRAELNGIRAGSAISLHADLADFDRLPELVGLAIRRFGRLDALINNASAFYPTPLGSATAMQWDDLFASNARAPFFLAQAAAPHLRATRGGIVNLADIHGERPLANHGIYCMAKAALLMLSKSLAVELAPDVQVNAIAPGAILWPDPANGQPAKDPEAQAALLARTPLQRVGTAEEVAAAVSWLLQGAGYVTGQTLHLDGGRHLG
ncbi:MAG: pteridine reductase [Pseudomonadota bacterium]